MKILSSLTDNLVEHCLSKNNLVEAKILMNWNTIANENSKITFPGKVKFMNNNRNNISDVISGNFNFNNNNSNINNENDKVDYRFA